MMTHYLMNRFPDYMDDRLTLEVVLSDNLKYKHYNLLNSNLVSSWYDPSQDRAIYAFDMNDVPEEFRGSLI